MSLTGAIAAKVDAAKAAGTAVIDDAKAKVSNPVDSLAKVLKDSKKEAAAAVNSPPENLTVFKERFLSEGYAKHPKVKLPTKNAADFYRRGKIKEVVDKRVSYELPPRFLQDPTEEAPASIRLLGKPTKAATGEDVDLIPPFSKFFLEGVQEGHAERNQIVETFGDFYVFFFGERPPIYTFNGILLNTDNTNWAQDFMFYYDNFLRGTKCVELNAKLVLTYGFNQIEGFLLNTSMAIQAISEKGVSVSFQMLVIDRKILKLSLDFGLLEANGTFAKDEAFLDLLTKGLSDSTISDKVVDVKAVVNGKEPPAKPKTLGPQDLAAAAKQFAKTKMESTPAGGVVKKLGV